MSQRNKRNPPGLVRLETIDGSKKRKSKHWLAAPGMRTHSYWPAFGSVKLPVVGIQDGSRGSGRVAKLVGAVSR